ncbi:MAG: contractile injection system tape measure protein, partial [Chitinophagales bacterium]
MKHVIQKQIFEIRMGNEEEAVAVQDRISSVFRNKLVQIIEKILDAHSNPNQLIRIDKLELDLGKISLYDLENDFILKLTEKLPLALSEIITNAELSSDKQGVSITTSSQSSLELLDFYLQNGALPWWHKAKNESIEEIFHQLIAERPRETAHLLQKLGSQKGVQQRLSYQFSNSILEKIIRILIPKYALSVNTHINKIQQEFQNYRKSTVTQTAFKNQLYTFTLQHIFESKNLFTLSIFKSDLKTKTTERFGFRKKETKSIFRDSTKKAPNLQKDPSVQATQSIHSQFEILRFFLKTGRLPDSSHIHTKDSLEDIFSAFLDQKPQQLIRFLQLINSPHQISQRIVHQFSEKTVARLSNLLVQEEASFVNTYFNNLDKIYDFKSSRKSKLEQQLQTNTLSFFLQKHTQFSPQNFNQHITSQLLQKNTITKKEASETFALVTERSLPKGKTSTSTAAILLPKEASPKENKTYNLIQTIEYFLEHGRIPTTTAPLLKHLSFDQLFAQLLETQATQLYLLLHQTFTKENRQKRFIQQLPERLFHQTIQLLQPHFAPQIHEYQKEINRLYQQNPDFFHSKAQFQHLQRSAIIRYLLKAPNRAFDLLNFVQQSTQEISTQFSKKITRPTHEIAEEWRAILQEKITTPSFPSKGKTDPKPTASETLSPKTLIESIAYFLEYARLPDQVESSLQRLSFEALFINLLEKQAQKTYPFLRNAAKTNEAQERLILQLSEKTLLQLIEVLQPKFIGF